MLAIVGRTIVGSVVAPTVDLFRGRDVGVKDYLPFGHVRDEGYSMDDFAKDLGYTAVGAVIAASPQITLVGSSILSGGTVSTGLGTSAVAAAAYIPVFVAAGALAYAAGAGHDMTLEQRHAFNQHRFRSR